MNFAKILTVLLISSLVSVSSHAFETDMKPHAMLYLTIPLDGVDAKQDEFNFGFRLDNIAYTPGKPVNYQQQLQRTAVLDFRMDSKGLDGLYISGVDYVKLYKVLRQNEEAAGADQPAAEATDADAAVDEEAVTDAKAKEEEDDGLTMGDHVRGVLADMRSVAPMGIWMGVGLGVGLLLGVGD